MPDDELRRRKILGEAMTIRRQELGYSTRMDLTQVPGHPAYSVLTDMELGRRSNFGRDVILKIERLYGLPYGTIGRFLAGEIDSLELTEGRAGERDEQAQFERELEELRHHARSALLLADRISGRCQDGRNPARSAAG